MSHKYKILTVFALGFATLAQAQINLTFQEGPQGLTISAAGTFQAGVNGSYDNSLGTLIENNASYQRIISTPSAIQSSYGGFGAVNPAGDTLPIQVPLAQTYTNFTREGDVFGFTYAPAGASFVHGPSGFVAGNSISGSITFATLGFADIGMGISDSGSFAIGGQTFTWSAIPEPSNHALIFTGALGICLLIKRRFCPKARG